MCCVHMIRSGQDIQENKVVRGCFLWKDHERYPQGALVKAMFQRLSEASQPARHLECLRFFPGKGRSKELVRLEWNEMNRNQLVERGHVVFVGTQGRLYVSSPVAGGSLIEFEWQSLIAVAYQRVCKGVHDCPVQLKVML